MKQEQAVNQGSDRSELIAVLKTALKAKGFTYRDLAETLGVSEQSVKRLFRDQDCSLSRLEKICEAIGVSLLDLVLVARNRQEPLTRITPEQERFLASHISHFNILFLLTQGYSVTDIQARHGLSQAQMYAFLRALEVWRFLDIKQGLEIRLRVEGHLSFPLGGALHEHIKSMNSRFLSQVLDEYEQEDRLFDSGFRRVSQSTLQRWRREMEELVRQVRRSAYQDERLLPADQLVPVKWTLCLSPFDWFAQLEVNPEDALAAIPKQEN
ncbi:helix-turn-helix domain-containing protein [Hahella sp. KA22]|uniref:helix-turn-helix domain-containing protein n=1 Tax=Hahella sp. KA22 TaxID=1628392 RepID=UPI000FDD84CA|nr:helix-turn-helix transcriptional regulator [Hahella sp. KA22]AZZ91460.1 XRE family transcriptional regulator [Hahella sp. KA22]QAY54829.1 helix-turn-helix domain-containing protein [Hahella sp. KA22]